MNRASYTNSAEKYVDGYTPKKIVSRPAPGGHKRKRKPKRSVKKLIPMTMITGSMLLGWMIIKTETANAPAFSSDIGYVYALDENEAPGSSAMINDLNRGSKTNKADDKYLILVSSNHLLGRDYVPENMVDIQKQVSSLNREILLERTAAEALESMLNAMEGQVTKTLTVVSGYRTYEYQENLFNKEVDSFLKTMGREEAKIQAAKLVALPGGSEHQTGLALDISTDSLDYKLTESFENTDCYKWLAANCADYGFIVRYPKDKVNETGISYEPWHLRYVGVENAKSITKQNLSLEEYCQK